MRIGIDIGGTFTDFALFDPTEQIIHTFKQLSPEEWVLSGLARSSRDCARHAAQGQANRDIGRQNRPALHDLFATPPTPAGNRGKHRPLLSG